MSKRGSDPLDKPVDRQMIFQRLKSLSGYQGFFPVSLNPQLFADNPHIWGLHMLLKVSLTHFTEAVFESFLGPNGPTQFWIKRGLKWKAQLQLIGFNKAEAMAIIEDEVEFGREPNGAQIKWLSFRSPEQTRERSESIAMVQSIFSGRDLKTTVRGFHESMQKQHSYWETARFDALPFPAPAALVTPEKIEPDAKKPREYLICEQDLSEIQSRQAEFDKAIALLYESEWFQQRCLVVDEEVTPNYLVKVQQLLKRLEKPGPGGSGIIMLGDSFDSKWIRIPNYRGNGRQTHWRKAQLLDSLAEYVSFEPEVAARLVRLHREVFKEAAEKAKLVVGEVFSEEESDQVRSGMDLSYEAYGHLLEALHAKRQGSLFASKRMLLRRREELNNPCVDVVVLEVSTGKKGFETTCEATFVTQDMWVSVARELNFLATHNEFLDDFKLRDAEEGRGELALVKSLDKGQNVVKGFFHVVAARHPQSPQRRKMIWLYEAKNPNQKKQPNDTRENWKLAMDRTHGYNDIEKSQIVRIENDFVVVPAKAVPEGAVPQVEASESDKAHLDDHRSGKRKGTPGEEEKRRDECALGSAVIITADGKCLGVRVTGATEPLYFSFATPPRAQGPGPLRIYITRVLLVADLAAAMAADGMEDQGPHTCWLCNLSAAEFKVACRTQNTPLRLRSHEFQSANLSAFAAQGGAKKTPVKGVSASSLFPLISYENRVVPPLHMDLGVGNKAKDLLVAHLRTLGSEDPVAASQAFELKQTIEGLAEIVDDTAARLDDWFQRATDCLELVDSPFLIARAEVDAALLALEPREDQSFDVESWDGPWSPMFQAGMELMELLAQKVRRLRENGPDSGSRHAAGTGLGANRTTRQLNSDMEAAAKVDDIHAKIDSGLADLLGAIEADKEARIELSHVDPNGDSDGALVAELNRIMDELRIFEESYWGLTMNGPSVRRFIHSFGEIITRLKAKCVELHYRAEDFAFLDQHAAVMAPYSELSPLMRTTRMLSDEEINRVDVCATSFGAAFRAAHGNDSMFHKAHLVEKHVPLAVRKFGTLGRLSEEACESMHVWYRKAAHLCRTIKNQEARARATLKYVEAKQNAGTFQREIKRRPRAAAAAVPAPAPGPAPAPTPAPAPAPAPADDGAVLAA